MIGIEYDKEVANKTMNRLRKYNNVKIIQGNAVYNIPQEGTIFYFFNPFTEIIMCQFSEMMKKMFQNQKDIQMLYYRPKQLQVFQRDPAWRVQKFEIPINNLDYRFKRLHKYRESYRQYAVITFA
ncbi:GCN5-related N-acetyltransferase [Candidatus Vecturithrix granuli]|uniref:GCN5-related N-acetyltransferase n=1 Tax=Vecturithrix granuli TaxID=1499967 RepID=A0A081C3Y9_VECG1|nr:GCN5-related N-acetyltransferase [Candidatus Vecturithrix granuli]